MNGFHYSFTKSITLLAIFILFTPIALTVSIFSLFLATAKTQPQPQVLAAETKAGANIFAALPGELATIDAQVGSSDARAEILRKYLTRYDSPLMPYADYIVAMADKYEMDFRLTTAIAQQESNLCKVIPEGTSNCWGWGIHSQGTLGFESYEEGIKIVTEGLKREYINKGLLIPENIMQKYTPLSDGSWAYGVRLFMEEMR
ncbi:hypothetical protein A2803_05885 [Candidatus Woesebacteria bacterium RIFCSPHIGHO2_01_FULL_44_21]|uniref:Mannosyl-glycoprotein endo-beta-N-acetylglucosamidase-like domain-containing protein n=1 Tax=Candidatus Woesebacteria bacterium RIFCSPHIGHO2_01_FULL_44_21 TaxID=1802503 RepID=A0A1F7YZX2_9BACT|nr:MAG: hypothetical protein A2803_05885 [Candidatus Woesebacteria bacterium RIFCSPHIGHO2_01_FULL_44_21]OGM71088.1 MAG: hypothetical protein A2897_02540 [Candidatus Woesebacteria bacterium RIFCSPLOWO2_01_FULL_44_24b]